ncbi:MAG: hypothetical protein H0T17_04650 [Propionibacteriales bacterium]|nr:hypothetical protein [Propionibacteriales bacterium]
MRRRSLRRSHRSNPRFRRYVSRLTLLRSPSGVSSENVVAVSSSGVTGQILRIDVLVFTGGVGEHSSKVRCRAAERLGFLGVAIDSHRNETTNGDGDISMAGATVRTWVITAREDLQIAREARQLLDAGEPL